MENSNLPKYLAQLWRTAPCNGCSFERYCAEELKCCSAYSKWMRCTAGNLKVNRDPVFDLHEAETTGLWSDGGQQAA